MTFPERAPARPIWLLTLADLALLLVGFFVLMQAQGHDRARLARGIRAGFGLSEPVAPAAPAPMPVAAAGLFAFAPGSATLPGSPAAVIAWARESARDPRVVVTVTGETDSSAADVDPLTGSAAILAVDRARALAAALAAAHAVAPARLQIATASHRRRAAIATLGFTGSQP
jgi:hypothetical protein